MEMSRKPLPKLAEMPYSVKKLIVESSPFSTRTKLKVASKEFYHVTKSLPLEFELVCVNVESDDQLEIQIQDRFELITFVNDGLVRETMEGIVSLFNHVKTSCSHVLICEDPDEFPIRTPFCDEFLRALEPLRHQLNVTHLNLELQLTEDELIDVLSHFIPTNLEKIALHLKDYTHLERVAEVDQWRQANGISIEEVEHITQLPIFHTNFPRVTWSLITTDDLKFAIQKMLEPTTTYRTLRITNADCEDDALPLALGDFTPIYAANGTFIKMPSAFLKIGHYVRSGWPQIILTVLPREMSDKWPKNEINEGEEDIDDQATDEDSEEDEDEEESDGSDEDEEEDENDDDNEEGNDDAEQMEAVDEVEQSDDEEQLYEVVFEEVGNEEVGNEEAEDNRPIYEEIYFERYDDEEGEDVEEYVAVEEEYEEVIQVVEEEVEDGEAELMNAINRVVEEEAERQIAMGELEDDEDEDVEDEGSEGSEGSEAENVEDENSEDEDVGNEESEDGDSEGENVEDEDVEDEECEDEDVEDEDVKNEDVEDEDVEDESGEDEESEDDDSEGGDSDSEDGEDEDVEDEDVEDEDVGDEECEDEDVDDEESDDENSDDEE